MMSDSAHNNGRPSGTPDGRSKRQLLMKWLPKVLLWWLVLVPGPLAAWLCISELARRRLILVPGFDEFSFHMLFEPGWLDIWWAAVSVLAVGVWVGLTMWDVRRTNRS